MTPNPYNRDLKNLEFHLFDTGHFTLEEDGAEIERLRRQIAELEAKVRQSWKPEMAKRID